MNINNIIKPVSLCFIISMIIDVPLTFVDSLSASLLLTNLSVVS